ncbi:MAG TPA: hypothetical protein VNZ64_24585 [Candidatus Acidoferrum sp.]|nr:hypothetical protein [Candidatus Acidoferrum sp.]
MAGGLKLSAGATQVPRSTAPAPSAARKFTPRSPRGSNSLLKYGLLLVVVAAVGGIGYFYGLPALTKALDHEPNAKPPAGANASQTGGSGGGPLGEVNGAMDVSETLDGGSTPKTRPTPATTNTARSQPVVPPR